MSFEMLLLFPLIAKVSIQIITTNIRRDFYISSRFCCGTHNADLLLIGNLRHNNTHEACKKCNKILAIYETVIHHHRWYISDGAMLNTKQSLTVENYELDESARKSAGLLSSIVCFRVDCRSNLSNKILNWWSQFVLRDFQNFLIAFESYDEERNFSHTTLFNWVLIGFKTNK